MNEYEMVDRSQGHRIDCCRRIRVGALPAHGESEQLAGGSVPSSPRGTSGLELVGVERAKAAVGWIGSLGFLGGLITVIVQNWR